MKLSAREDLSAPIEDVFAQLSDFDAFERAALRRGAEVVRTDSLGKPGPGMAWKAAFDYRGRSRNATIEVKDYGVPDRMRILAVASGMEIEMLVELVSMSRTRTRMNVSTEARARSLAARLLLQSMKLARQNVLKRYRKRIGEFAASVEDRCRRG